MNAAHSAALPPAAVATYETLRSHVLNAPSRCAGELGVVVLLRHGMLAWARTQALVPRDVRSSPLHPDPTPASTGIHDELVDVMVAMTSSVFRAAQRGALAI